MYINSLLNLNSERGVGNAASRLQASQGPVTGLYLDQTVIYRPKVLCNIITVC